MLFCLNKNHVGILVFVFSKHVFVTILGICGHIQFDIDWLIFCLLLEIIIIVINRQYNNIMTGGHYKFAKNKRHYKNVIIKTDKN